MSGRIMRERIEIGETAASVICEQELLSAVIEGIARARGELKRYIGDHPEFLLSLDPLEPGADAPEIVVEMCRASSMTGVGPMAAVAGAVAAAGVESAVRAGATHCIVDNGGDIAMVLDRPVDVGLLMHIDSDILPAVEIPPTHGGMLGLCTSSGRYGQSISLGGAEMATVMADDPIVADAHATALGNACTDASATERALRELAERDEVIWAIAVCDGFVGTMGEIPGLHRGSGHERRLTVHSQFPSVSYATQQLM